MASTSSCIYSSTKGKRCCRFLPIEIKNPHHTCSSCRGDDCSPNQILWFRGSAVSMYFSTTTATATSSAPVTTSVFSTAPKLIVHITFAAKFDDTFIACTGKQVILMQEHKHLAPQALGLWCEVPQWSLNSGGLVSQSSVLAPGPSSFGRPWFKLVALSHCCGPG